MGFGSGGSGGSGSVAGSSDVQLSNPANTNVFTYNGTLAKWENAAAQSIGRVAVNARTASYTLVLSDEGQAIEVTASGATTVTVPTNAAVAFPIGTIIEIVQIGTGTVTLAGASGVTLQSANNALVTRAQFSAVSIRKRATNTWLVVGDLA